MILRTGISLVTVTADVQTFNAYLRGKQFYTILTVVLKQVATILTRQHNAPL